MLEIRGVAYDHPDAQLLIEEVQAEYVRRYGGRDDSPVEVAAFLPPDGLFLVGYLDGVPVATGAWRRLEILALGSERVAELKRMYVVPARQRTGLAREMLAELEATARKAGYEVMALETGLRQPEAIALYGSAGYVPVPPFGFYADAPISVHLAKRL